MKILILDIETAPMIADVWSLWEQNVGLNQIVHDWYILSWAAKWADGKKVYYADQSKAENLEDDSEILRKLWALLDEADIVIAHNGSRFDIPKINARFIKAGLPPPSPYRQIDTLKLAKAKFKFTSNRLAYLAKFLGVGTKEEHPNFPGHLLWVETRKGNAKAWREMRKYNIQDVLVLEQVYAKLRPWDSKHPNLGVDGGACPVCAAAGELEKRGFHYTNGGKYQRYVCKACGAWSRGKTNLLSKEDRKGLVQTL